MKNNKVTIIRALFAMTVGVLLIIYPDYTTQLLVVMIGLMFLVPGLVSIASAFVRPKTPAGEEPAKKSFPILGIGSSIMGLVLVIIPDVFIKILMYILGASLVAAGVYQLVEYTMCAKLKRMPIFMYVVSVLVLLAGIFIFLNPIKSAELPFIVLGVSSIVYGLAEIVKAVKFHKIYRTVQQQLESADEAETADAEEIVAEDANAAANESPESAGDAADTADAPTDKADEAE